MRERGWRELFPIWGTYKWVDTLTLWILDSLLTMSSSFWSPDPTSGGLWDYKSQSCNPGLGLGHSAGPESLLPWFQPHSSTTEHSRLALWRCLLPWALPELASVPGTESQRKEEELPFHPFPVSSLWQKLGKTQEGQWLGLSGTVLIPHPTMAVGSRRGPWNLCVMRARVSAPASVPVNRLGHQPPRNPLWFELLITPTMHLMMFSFLGTPLVGSYPPHDAVIHYLQSGGGLHRYKSSCLHPSPSRCRFQPKSCHPHSHWRMNSGWTVIWWFRDPVSEQVGWIPTEKPYAFKSLLPWVLRISSIYFY